MPHLIEIPSPIDVHVHLREPGDNKAETIESGTRAAYYGGYQAVFDMPNNPGAPTHTLDRLIEKQHLAHYNSHTDIGFYAGIDLANPKIDEIPRMISRAAGLKLYMDHTTGNTQKHGLEAACDVIDTWVDQAEQQDLRAPILLHAREEIGEETARYIAGLGHAAHWCHIATATEAEASVRLSAEFPDYFTAGVTPHHLTMTDRNANFQQGWNGARMQPPLGNDADATALLNGYNNGTIQILETDHAPHLRADKMKAESENPAGDTDPGCQTCFGVSGIEHVLPIMFALESRGWVSKDRIMDSLYDQPLHMLGIAKTAMRAVTVLSKEPHVLSSNSIAGLSHNTPYIGWTGAVKVIGTKSHEGAAMSSVHDRSKRRQGMISILEGQRR